jgi:ribosome-associated protein
MPDPEEHETPAAADIDAAAPDPATTPAGPETDVRRRRARREHVAQDDVPFHAVSHADPARVARALENARVCARIADDNRGKEILLLDLRQATSLVDYFVIVTATSRRMSHAIAEEVDKEMKKRGERKLGLEGSEEGRWVLIDYGDFVVHVLSPEARTYYALEEIWGDAERVEWEDPDRPRAPTAAAE